MRARLLTLPLALALLGTLSAATLAQTDIIAPQLRITTDPEMADIRFDGALRRRQLALILSGKMEPSEATELRALFVED